MARTERRGRHRAEAAERRARSRHPVEEMGTLPQRAAVGHGPRGLQRRRQRLGLLLPRPVPLARLPLGRGRPRRHLRRQAAAVLCAGAVERARPDPEGAPVRADQQRGQPRRGRQGVLLLHRQHADALVHEVSVQVSAAGVPVPRPGRDEPRAGRARSSSTSCSIPASSTTTATSTCSSSTRRRARKTSSSASPCTIAGPKRRGCDVLPTLWFRNTWSWGEDDRKPSLREAGAGVDPGVASRPRRLLAVLRWRARSCCSPRTRATRSVCGDSRTRRPTSRTRSTTTSSRDSATRSTRHGSGPRPRRTTSLDVPAGGSQTVRLRLAAAGTGRCLRRLRRRSSTSRIADADEFYERITPPSLNEDRAPRAPPGAGRHAVEQAVLLLRSRAVAAASTRAIRCSTPRGSGVRNTEWFHMLNADVISMPDKWEYPWYAAWDLAFHTLALVAGRLRFRQGAAAADAAQPVLPPQRADSRLRVELQRRESAGARLGHAVPLQDGADARPGGPPLPGALVPGADAELQLVGQPQGSRRAATSSPADSSGSTTSASSTAARSSPPAARSSRRTARRGWRSTASACWRSR